MAADSNILREYLVSLGFKVDERGAKKADHAIVGMDKGVKLLGKGVVGLAAAVTGMVTVFTYQMEKLYYASRRADSTVGAIQAMEFGAKNIGISGEAMKSALINMAMSLRMNPGLVGLLNKLGVKVEGRDMSDVMKDLVDQTKKMPFMVGARFAQMFGIDNDTYFMLREGSEKLKAAEAERKQMALDAGVDSDKAAKAAVEYANALRGLWERVGLLKDAFAGLALPYFLKGTNFLNDQITQFALLVSTSKDLAEVWDRLGDGFMGYFFRGLSEWAKIFRGMVPDSWRPAGKTGKQPQLVPLADSLGPGEEEAPPDLSTMKGRWQSLWKRPGVPAEKQGVGGPTGAPPATTSPAAFFGALESKYGLPDGFLDKLWKKESGRGTNMLSKKGAKGHFQFMDGTAGDYGLQDPNDLGASATAAARYMSDLLARYKGNLAMATAAWNWGMGNVDRKGLGMAPAETRDFVKDLTGVTIQQTNHNTVTGVSDPVKAAAHIETAQRSSNADIIRQFTPRLR